MTQMSAYKDMYSDDREPHALNHVVEKALAEKRAEFLGFLTRKLQNTEHAEDVLQDVCMRAMSNASNLRAETSVIPWLYRILRSTLSDFLRQDAIRRSRDAEYAGLQDPHTKGPDDPSSGDFCCCLHQALPGLKQGYAELVKRIDLAGHNRSVVALQLDLTSNSLAVRLHRARRALGRVLLRTCATCSEQGFLNCECGIPHDHTRPTHRLVPQV